MRQSTLAEAGFQRYSKRTLRERFLQEMDRVVPWEALRALIEPVYYPNRRGAGRPAVGLERMLRIHFLQHWFNLSDPGVEEALYDSGAMRQFVGTDLGRASRCRTKRRFASFATCWRLTDWEKPSSRGWGNT